MCALQNGRNALETHAGIDRGLRQTDPLAWRDLLELHEHKVPDFDEAIPILIRGAWRTAGNLVAMVEKDFRARPARPRIPHGPEIVGRRNTHDFGIAQSGNFLPERVRLVILVIDRHHQTRGIETVFFGDQVPGKFDRTFLEIITEGEIAQHLEERMMPRRIADIIEIIMLAARAHTFLRCRSRRVRTLLDTGKNVFKLHHAGISEHQCRIITRNQRTGGDDLVAVPCKIIEKYGPDFVNAAHDQFLPLSNKTGPACQNTLHLLVKPFAPVE